jgi:histidinol dehydrogenase
MRVRRFEWEGAAATAAAMRSWAAESEPDVNVGAIFAELTGGVSGRKIGDDGRVEEAAALALTNRFDATAQPRQVLAVHRDAAERALAGLEPGLREALDLAVANVRAVATAQLSEPRAIDLPQGQRVNVREVPVGAAGIYAPGGRAVYPSSVVMCAVPAKAAGVERVALASPPRPDGELHPLVLAAAALCEVDEIYAIGGAQAIFTLAHGTASIDPVDVIAGPGNAWVREAKRAVYGRVGIDSLAGPSELMVVAGHDVDPEWAALDLCAQAEHGSESPLLLASVERHVLEAIEAATTAVAGARPSVEDAPLALVQVPDTIDAIDLANAYAPEHLELLEDDATLLAERAVTAGCVFVGHRGATAFGDYVAGSNHVLPTGGAGRFSGPLGPGVFRRRISSVEIPPAAAAALAPHVDALARTEGLPVHGESAMIRR